MPTIIGPDGAQHVFPDDTPTSVIKGVMARHYGVKAAPEPGAAVPASALPSAPGVLIGQSDDNASTPVQWKRAQPLLRNGDADIENLRNYLGVAPGAGPIQAPPSGQASQYAGQAVRSAAPSISDRLSMLGERTGILPSDPQYWRRAVYGAKLPERLYEGAMSLPKGAAQAIPHAVEWLTSGAGMFDNAVSRAAGGAAKMADAAINEEARRREIDRVNAGYAPGESDPAEAAGSMLSPFGVTKAGPAIAGAMSPAYAALRGQFPQRPVSTLAEMGKSAVTGGLMAAAEPVRTDRGEEYGPQKLNQMEWGAGLGAAFPLAGKIINPATPEAVALHQEGVKPTFGQMLGPTANAWESMASSIPIIGDAIRYARRGSIESFNQAAYNRALKPIGKEMPENIPVGREGVDYVHRELSNEFENAIKGIEINTDKKFHEDVKTIMLSKGNILPKSEYDQLKNLLKSELIDKVPKVTAEGATLSGQMLREIDTKLGLEARRFRASQDPNHQNLGESLYNAQELLRDLIERQAPEVAPKLAAAREGWANLVRIEKAASSAGAENGIFTPAQFSNAVRMNDPSVRRASYARGRAMMQDLSDRAKTVLPQNVPNSGTFDRAALASLAAGHFISPATGLALAGVSAAYTSPVQSGLRGLMMSYPQARAEIQRGLVAAAPLASYEIGQGMEQ